MITLYSGIPGSGKTYKMVNDLLEFGKDFFVVHNIDGLKSDYFDFGLTEDGQIINHSLHFPTFCEQHNMTVDQFFDRDYQKLFTQEVKDKYKKNCLVIIDEAQEWFSKYKKSLVLWLSYHRHLAQDVWLVTHRASNLPSIYRSFIEMEYRGKTNSYIYLPGYFIYNRISGGERTGFIKVRKKKNVFESYKSVVVTGKTATKKSYLLPGLIILIIIGVGYFVTMPFTLFKSSKSNSSVAASVPASASVPPAALVPPASSVTFPVKLSADNVLTGVRLIGLVGNDYLYFDYHLSKTLFVSKLPYVIVLSLLPSGLLLYDTQKQSEYILPYIPVLIGKLDQQTK